MLGCRAGELRGLYRGLQLQGLAAAERLDVLLHAKLQAMECDCSLTRDLVQLIDCEAVSSTGALLAAKVIKMLVYVSTLVGVLLLFASCMPSLPGMEM